MVTSWVKEVSQLGWSLVWLETAYLATVPWMAGSGLAWWRWHLHSSLHLRPGGFVLVQETHGQLKLWEAVWTASPDCCWGDHP